MSKVFRLFLFFISLTFSAFSQSWTPLSNGTNNLVNGLFSFQGDLYATGYFDSAGTVPASGIAEWDGVQWNGVGNGIRPAGGYSMAEYDSSLIAGGIFDTAGILPVNNIARWDGAHWNQLRNGSATTVTALQVYNNDLIACGKFDTGATGQYDFNFAKWDGMRWSAFGNTNNVAGVMGVYNNELYLGGAFDELNNSSLIAEHILRWDGNNWADVDSGFDGIPYTMIEYNNELVIAGDFEHVGRAQPYHHIVKWNGSNWSALGAGTNKWISSLAVYNGELYAGGGFDSAGNVPVSHIAKWNGTSWQSVGAGFDDWVISLAVHNSDLYACGFFQNSGLTPVRHVARLNTETFISSENLLPATFSIYPNPASSAVHIRNCGFPDEESFYILTDQMGQCLRKIKRTGVEQPISVIDLANGIYFIQCVNATAAFTQILFVQHH
ncbi:MAG TPA: T9SS type A sorting domain-containing protein [Bacteroidia bacterium]|nr:T9SS type A sorting domain-containing protein [Bacteroidia bacterium]